mgnify:CR=1 FL=1
MNTVSYKAFVTADVSILFNFIPEYCLKKKFLNIKERFTQVYIDHVNEALTWPQII